MEQDLQTTFQPNWERIAQFIAESMTELSDLETMLLAELFSDSASAAPAAANPVGHPHPLSPPKHVPMHKPCK